MIDLNQIGYNVLQKDGEDCTEITGGLTLTVRIKVSGLAPDPEGLALHVKKRIREKIWDMAYGHLKQPLKELKEALEKDNDQPGVVLHAPEFLDKLEEAIWEP